MKKSLTQCLRAQYTDGRAEQSRAEQSRAVNSFSAAFCCLNLNIWMKRPISDTE